MTELRKNRNRITDALFVAVILSTALLLVQKAPYGFHFFDEANWLALPYRLLRGDALLVDDWSITQMGLSLLYPLIKLYRLFFAGTEGIILWFRYAFIFFHAVNAAILYLLLRRSSAQKAFFAAVLYFVSCGSVKALSYYQMAQDFVLLSTAILATAKKPSVSLPVSGFLFALAVLNCPFLILIYALYTLLCLISAAGKRGSAFRIKSWLLFSSGSAAAAILFFAFVFSRCGMEELFAAVPRLFGDKAHDVGMTGKKLLRFIPELLSYTKRTDIPAILALILILADKNRGQRRSLYAVAAAITAAAAIVWRYRATLVRGVLSYDLFIKMPLCLFGAAAYFLCEKRDGKIFHCIYTGGVALFLCMYLASDTGANVANYALTISAAAGVCCIVQLAAELLREVWGGKLLRYMAAVLCVLTLVLQLGVELMYRKNYCFSEPAGTSMMYCTIDRGIGKGERTTEEVCAYEFEGLWDATEKVRNAEGEYVLYFSADCWPYLEDSKKCASFSTWIQGGASLVEAERMLLYWEMHPERKPDAIYISKTVKNPERVIELLNTEGFPVEENERGYVLLRAGGLTLEGD